MSTVDDSGEGSCLRPRTEMVAWSQMCRLEGRLSW